MKFWEHVLQHLEAPKKVYLLTVIQNSGSSPGRKGFKMMVAYDGFIHGSVGGGVMEYALVEQAKKLLQTEQSPTFIKKQIHRGAIKDGSGMICSGEQTVAFHCLKSHDIPTINSILKCTQNGQQGRLTLMPNSFTFSSDCLSSQFYSKIDSSEDWLFEEHIGFKETLYIIGGGHVGVAVSELFEKLGFQVVVIDNRENLNTLQNNNSAHRKLTADYNEIHKYIKSGSSSYIAIMTNKYTDDKLVVSKLVNKQYAFIGVLGSKAKLKTMWKELLTEGFDKETLSKVYAPIGLPIKSETPEEIAISIAAQIIQLKNMHRKSPKT